MYVDAFWFGFGVGALSILALQAATLAILVMNKNKEDKR